MSNKISNVEEFDNYLNSDAFNGSPFSRMSESDLDFFKVQLKFSDDGSPAGYWGDIVEKEKFNDSELGDFVNSVFGTDKDEFLKCLHYFGTMQGTCNSRPYFNCPYC